MSENIVKLRVDGKDFDNNIKSARQGLLAMEQACRKVGGTLEVVEKDELEFVRALGKMETSSKSAKGKIAELTSAFTDLKAQYNRLTDAEKQAPFGKALSASMDQLKARIQAGNAELKGIQGELGNTGGSLQDLAGKFGINIGQMAKFATAGSAVSAVLQVAKDAFMSSETNVDNWGRTVEATKSVYESFCIALSNGSLDGWFSNMDLLIQKAKDAYNAIDDLNTKMTIINPERVKVQGQIQSQKEIIRQKGKDSAEGKAAAAEIKRLEPKLKDTYKQEADMNFKAFREEVDKKLAEAGIILDSKSKDLLMRSFSDTKAFENIRRNAKGSTGTRWVSAGAGSYKEDYDTRNTNQKLLDIFTDKWRSKNSSFLTAGYNAKMQSANVGIQDARYTGAGSGGTTKTKSPKEEIDPIAYARDNAKVDTSIMLAPRLNPDALREWNKEIQDALKEVNMNSATTGAFSALTSDLQNQMSHLDVTSGMYQQLQAQLADTTALQNLIKTAMENGFSFQDLNFDVEEMWNKILSPEGVENADWQGIVDSINAKLAELNIPPIQLKFETGNLTQVAKESKTSADNLRGASQACQALGSALSSIEDPGAKVAGILAQAVANIMLGFAQASAAPATSAAGVFGWIAAVTAGLATAVATVAQIKSVGSYAEGGRITGPSYTGDAVPIMANAGEVVLNASQQEMLAANLQSAQQNGGGGGRSTISGEQIVTVVNAYGRRTGRGEILR